MVIETWAKGCEFHKCKVENVIGKPTQKKKKLNIKDILKVIH